MDDNTRTQMMFQAQKKSTGAAYVLWFFLGGFGAHRFYLGQTGTAIAQLLLLLLGWIPVGLGWIALGVWWLIDAFLIPGIIEREDMATIQRLGGNPGFGHGQRPGQAMPAQPRDNSNFS
uniref:TM2 domain-containing protein n=1 Tax=Parerythrobacter lutipelagi TaxID=1964208 RepID=UPI0010F5C410|nr:TM2 domain-containing protein [Parerythrobacter lutipelagi]